jgi:colanic acid/amylovoran biosynthesis glycosyltransferase
VRSIHPAISYDIIGEGPQRGQLMELTRSLGLERVVTFHGARDRRFVRQKMDDAHLFVLPSVTAEDGDSEGQGVVLLEAQASGLPVVATDHDGFPESIAPGRSGFLVPERDVEALSSRIVDLICRSDTWPEMGRAGRKHVEAHYEPARLSRQLVDLYGRLATEHRVRHG